MPLMQRGVAAFSNRIPKILSPKGHAVAEYIILGGFALLTAIFWRRNKRAAMASIICGISEATNILLSDCPGGIAKVISFPVHGKIDMGLGATCSALPNFMSFENEPESKYLRLMGLNITLITAMTDFEPSQRSADRWP